MHFYTQGVGNWNKWWQLNRWINFNVDIFQRPSSTSSVSSALARAPTRVRIPPDNGLVILMTKKDDVCSTEKLHYYKTTLSFKHSTWSSFCQARVESDLRWSLDKRSSRVPLSSQPTMALVLKHNMPAIMLKLRMSSSRYRYPYIIRWGVFIRIWESI